MKQDGKARLMGFYTTRWVEADSIAAAEVLGLHTLRSEYGLTNEEAWPESNAVVHVDEVVEVPAAPSQFVNRGATWFDMEDQGVKPPSAAPSRR